MKTQFQTIRLLVLSLLPLAAACQAEVKQDQDFGLTKQQAREIGGQSATGDDLCAQQGWYGDAACDDFCMEPDPDCPVSSACPNSNDPGVTYHGTPDDFEICFTDVALCGPDQIEFNTPECGCGCIDVEPSGPECGGIQGIACEPGFFCNYAIEDMCGAADQLGTCEPIPDACPEYYSPVCGCDGVTYGNPCEAHANGVSVIAHEACEAPSGPECGGIQGIACEPGYFCDYAIEDMCGAADQLGTCEVIPEACPEYYSPVCGCDGVTYGNACQAHASGVPIIAHEACSAP